MFPHGKTGGWRDPSFVAAKIKEARERAGAEWAEITSHVYRKTVATHLDDAGLSARVVADQLGKASITDTQDNYLGRGLANAYALEAMSDLLDPDSIAFRANMVHSRSDDELTTGS